MQRLHNSFEFNEFRQDSYVTWGEISFWKNMISSHIQLETE